MYSHYWDRCQNIPYHEPSRTYKEWLEEYDDMIKVVYDLVSDGSSVG